MREIVWLSTTLPVALLLPGIGVYAFRKKTPIGFFAGVPAPEVTDVRAYNRENGVMWTVFSLPFFSAAALGLWRVWAGTAVLLAGTFFGIPLLVFAYSHICRKYRKTE